MKKVLLAIAAFVLLGTAAFSQTAEELKAERQQLKSEMASKDYQKMEKKYLKLGDTPGVTSLNSVNGVVNASASILRTVASSEELLSQFKTEINETADGEIVITKYSAKVEDYVTQAAALGVAAIEAKAAVEQIKDAKNDVKGLNPLEAKSVTKALNWSSTALEVSAYKIDVNTRLINNIVKSCKAAKNL